MTALHNFETDAADAQIAAAELELETTALRFIEAEAELTAYFAERCRLNKELKALTDTFKSYTSFFNNHFCKQCSCVECSAFLRQYDTHEIRMHAVHDYLRRQRGTLQTKKRVLKLFAPLVANVQIIRSVFPHRAYAKYHLREDLEHWEAFKQSIDVVVEALPHYILKAYGVLCDIDIHGDVDLNIATTALEDVYDNRQTEADIKFDDIRTVIITNTQLEYSYIYDMLDEEYAPDMLAPELVELKDEEFTFGRVSQTPVLILCMETCDLYHETDDIYTSLRRHIPSLSLFIYAGTCESIVHAHPRTSRPIFLGHVVISSHVLDASRGQRIESTNQNKYADNAIVRVPAETGRATCAVTDLLRKSLYEIEVGVAAIRERATRDESSEKQASDYTHPAFYTDKRCLVSCTCAAIVEPGHPSCRIRMFQDNMIHLHIGGFGVRWNKVTQMESARTINKYNVIVVEGKGGIKPPQVETDVTWVMIKGVSRYLSRKLSSDWTRTAAVNSAVAVRNFIAASEPKANHDEEMTQ